MTYNFSWKVVTVAEHDFDLTFWTIEGGVDQIERTFWVKHPRTGTAQERRAVLLVFHGYGGGSTSTDSLQQWKALAEDLDLWLIAPDGVFKGWNAVDCCGDAIAHNIHEIDFIEAILHLIQQEYEQVDAQTIVATGHSNGGFLTSLLGQQHPDWLKAILPVAGYQYHNYEHLQPMSIFMHHGQNDTQVPVQGWCYANERRKRPQHAYDNDGGRRLIKEHPPEMDQCMSLQRVFEIWLQANSCVSTVTHQDHLKICQVGVACQVPTELCVWKNSRHSGNYTSLIPNASRDFLLTVMGDNDMAATFVTPGNVCLILLASALFVLFKSLDNRQRNREIQVTDATELVPIARELT